MVVALVVLKGFVDSVVIRGQVKFATRKRGLDTLSGTSLRASERKQFWKATKKWFVVERNELEYLRP